MKKSRIFNPNRREFLSKTVPICAASCLGASQIFAKTPDIAESLLQQDKHKFDKEIPGLKMTYNQYHRARNNRYIQFAKFLEKELGKEKTIEIIKKHSTERMLAAAKRDLKRLGNSDFKSYISIFRTPGMVASLTMEILEDTDTVFEIKVTECQTATTFLRAKAGDIGYATVCWGDYAWAEGFNPKIKMIRDKTLCQGDDYCNHRYVWTG